MHHHHPCPDRIPRLASPILRRAPKSNQRPPGWHRLPFFLRFPLPSPARTIDRVPPVSPCPCPRFPSRMQGINRLREAIERHKENKDINIKYKTPLTC